MGYATEVNGEGRLRLAEVATGATGGLDEREASARLIEVTAELRELQELLFAAEEHAVLVLLQGMDAAGKDVTISQVFDAASPEACRVKAFKPPVGEETAHDFLWRAHAAVPRLGELVIFDRSYYEQVVGERVMGDLDQDRVRRRYGHINGFEELLADEGKTIILKFFLHVSPEVQERRLEEREADPRTAWKTSVNDWAAREQWDAYMRAYEEAINACAALARPWYVVPSDHRWFQGLAVAEAFVARLRPYGRRWEEARERIGAEERRQARAARGADADGDARPE